MVVQVNNELNQELCTQTLVRCFFYAQVQYGEGTECGTQGDIKVKFNHETTTQSATDLQDKWYYKQCIAQKQSPEWAARGGNKLPTTEPCWLTLFDATSARKYHWDVKFVKL